MEIIASILNAIAWPIVILIIALSFQKSIGGILSRASQIKASSKGIELIIEKLEKENQLPFGAHQELSGLTAHDIWALDELASGKIETNIHKMKLAQKVISKTLIEFGLLEIAIEEGHRKVIATELGRKILRTAETYNYIAA